MSELLKKAVSAVAMLPDADQDEIARMMLAMSSDDEIASVPADHAGAIAEGLAQARAGRHASEYEVKAAWLRFES
jgi:predicted transcriptional regulator